MTRPPLSDEVREEMHRQAGRESLDGMRMLSLVMLIVGVFLFIVVVLVWRLG